MSHAGGDGNFRFLDGFDPGLGRLARQAEGYVYSDPDSCLFKLRVMIETMATRLVEMQMPNMVSQDLSAMLRALERSGAVPRRLADDLHAIRRDGNAAVHGRNMPTPTAMRRLRDVHGVSGWFCRMIRRGARVEPGKFVPPPPPRELDDRARRALKRAESLEDEIESRRRRTREALLLYGDADDAAADMTRLRSELEALDRVSAEAGEPLVDADSVMLIMAMELERLLSHPRLGMTAAEAKLEAERQLDDVKRELDDRETAYSRERAELVRDAGPRSGPRGSS